MKEYSLVMVFRSSGWAIPEVLCCKRSKLPYKGLLSFVEGEYKEGEGEFEGAYRGLEEETGLQRSDIVLHHIVDITMYNVGVSLKCFAGQIAVDKGVTNSENELRWVLASVPEFFDLKGEKFAGEGSMAMILYQALYEGKRLGRN